MSWITHGRSAGPELDFYAWGNDFFRSMIKWRHAKVEVRLGEGTANKTLQDGICHG